MLQLTEQYAKLKGTKVLDHREHDGQITFVLVSGPKLTMTRAELEAEIKKLSAPAPSAEDLPPPATAQAPKAKKGKAK